MSFVVINYLHKLRKEPITNLSGLCDFLRELTFEFSGCTARIIVGKNANESKIDDQYQRIILIDENDCYITVEISNVNDLTREKIEVIRAISWIAFGQVEHNKLIKRLRKSERIFDLTFEQVNSGRCVTDLEGYILESNQKFCDTIGYTQKEVKAN